MSEREAFIAAIAANPDDDLPRLAFADWLDEHGESDRAEFIRLQIATYRESEQFPPVLDEAKYDRIRELFEANGENWLRPVYDPLRVDLPRVSRPEPAGDATTLLGRLARGVTRVFAPLVAGVQQINPFTDRIHYYSKMLFVSHAGIARPIPNAIVSRGFVSALALNPAQLSEAARPDALTAEPITDLTLNLNGEIRHWQQISTPHFRRLHLLGLTFGAEGDGNFHVAAAHAFAASEHLAGLSELRLTAGISYIENEFRHANTMGVINALRRASFRTRLRRLYLDQIAGSLRFLADPHTSLDLRELSLSGSDSPEPELVTNLQRMPFRDRLMKLSLAHFPFDPLPLTSGLPWPSLETLWLTSTGLGDAGAAAFADSTAFPALQTLWLRSNGLTDDTARTLSQSPRIRQLRQLNLDGNTISEAGAEILAELLDRGLQQLSLVDTQLTTPTRRRLRGRYGHRISFVPPATSVSELLESS